MRARNLGLVLVDLPLAVSIEGPPADRGIVHHLERAGCAGVREGIVGRAVRHPGLLVRGVDLVGARSETSFGIEMVRPPVAGQQRRGWVVVLGLIPRETGHEPGIVEGILIEGVGYLIHRVSVAFLAGDLVQEPPGTIGQILYGQEAVRVTGGGMDVAHHVVGSIRDIIIVGCVTR